jgi:hypothetical protein
MDAELEKLIKEKEHIKKRIRKRECELLEARAVTVDVETFKELVQNFSNWNTYEYKGSDSHGYGLCSNDECGSSICAIRASLLAFDAYSEFHDSFIKCRCCISNNMVEDVEEYLDEYDESVEIDPDKLCTQDRERVLKKTKHTLSYYWNFFFKWACHTLRCAFAFLTQSAHHTIFEITGSVAVQHTVLLHILHLI